VQSIQTSNGSLEAGTFVLACGVGSPSLARMAGFDLPLKESPGVLLHTAPAPRWIDRVVLAPGTHFKQALDGRIVAGGPIVAGVGTAIMEASVEQAEEIRRLLAIFLPQSKDVPVERVTLGYRVMPADEYPILGFTETFPNIYVAATHSGVTLAPLIGRLASLEILDGVQAQALEPYRPSRF
jgi:glycine/D-amino acid oxidase-like deaminating enzyme